MRQNSLMMRSIHFYRNILLTFTATFFLVAASCLAGSPDPKELLQRTQKLYANATSVYSTSTVENPVTGLKTEVIMIQKTLPEGESVQRTEAKVFSGRKNEFRVTTLTTSDGVYQLFERQKVAAKLQYMTQINASSAAALGNSGLSPDDSTFEIDEVSSESVACYRVTQKISLAAIAKITSALTKNESLQKLVAESGTKIPIPAAEVYFISKDKGYIVGQETFDTDGNSISKILYSKVELNLPVDDSQLKVPANFKIRFLENPQELAKLMTSEIPR